MIVRNGSLPQETDRTVARVGCDGRRHHDRGSARVTATSASSGRCPDLDDRTVSALHPYARGLTVWSTADADTKWFSPSESSLMINYRVDNMDEMLEQLKQNGVEIVGGPDLAENGKFAWIMDSDGNKVELWEPMLWDEKNKA